MGQSHDPTLVGELMFVVGNKRCAGPLC
jgi:hypothetical protein